MTAEPDGSASEAAARQRDLVTLFVALVVAVLLSSVARSLTLRGPVDGAVLQVLVRDAAVWLPLASGIAWVGRRSGRDLRARLGLGLGDLVVALGIVVVARVVDAVVSVALTGSTGLAPVPSLGRPDVGLLLTSAIGIVLVSPALEELFFRGCVQRLLAAELPPRARWLAVLVSATAFGLAHLFLGAATTTLDGLQVFATTFVLGLLTGTLVALTDRIGGAVLAHVLFNAVAVAATWPR
ncbi:lysostaphin resistance A-like protein [Curtobacterium luteum]|uniref:CPBP family intramembrane glutamic endopeptidase n=1 Tax=Curtobacterium luteum TaxID=33881 RepID=UPI0037F213B4